MILIFSLSIQFDVVVIFFWHKEDTVPVFSGFHFSVENSVNLIFNLKAVCAVALNFYLCIWFMQSSYAISSSLVIFFFFSLILLRSSELKSSYSPWIFVFHLQILLLISLSFFWNFSYTVKPFHSILYVSYSLNWLSFCISMPYSGDFFLICLSVH